MKSKLSDAIKRVPKYVSINAAPRSAKEILADIYYDLNESSNKGDALIVAEKYAQQFINRISRILNDQSNSDTFGRVIPYCLNSSSQYMIQGAAFIEPHDDSELQELKRKLRFFDDYLCFFQSVDCREFESLCAGVLNQLGVISPRITPSSRDEGIDFYGILSLEKSLGWKSPLRGIEQQFNVWMIGQAKHFDSSQVSTENIRELVGSARLARSRAFSTRAETRYSDLKPRPCDPVFCLFFTTGEISRDAWTLMRNTGVIGMDGCMLAKFLAERGIGITAGSFDKQEISDWITKFSDRFD